MLTTFIDGYKQWRRKNLLDGLFSDGPTFAFLGVGQHSLDNLYPVLLSRGVRVKYIYSRRLAVAQQAARLFPGCTGVTALPALLNDPAINGVFICIKNEHQLPLVKACLDAGKYVFVEKPAVSSYAALQELMAHPHADKCMIAFNKRFSPMHEQLGQKIRQTFSYQAHYLTGVYPEGNPVMELFCHPVDNVISLFGPVLHYHLQQQPSKRGIQLQLLLQHAEVSGALELSTCYSWGLFRDTLSCLTSSQHITLTYPGTFKVAHLGRQVAGVPLDKLIRGRMQQENDAFTPVAMHNPVVQYGYFDEICYYVTTVKKGGVLSRAAPASFANTFLLLDQLQQQVTV